MCCGRNSVANGSVKAKKAELERQGINLAKTEQTE